MKITQIRRKPLRAAVLLIIPFAVYCLLRLAVFVYARTLMPYMPPCILRSFTGRLCPSCGMTHSVFALSRLDIIEACRENLMIPLAALFAVLWYFEQWLAAFGNQRKLLPRSGIFWVGVLIFWGVYAIARNFV